MSCVEGDTQICRYRVTFINLKVIYEINVDRQIYMYSDGISLHFAYPQKLWLCLVTCWKLQEMKTVSKMCILNYKFQSGRLFCSKACSCDEPFLSFVFAWVLENVILVWVHPSCCSFQYKISEHYQVNGPGSKSALLGVLWAEFETCL